MPLDPKIKEQIIEKFATHKGDTGSPEVQAALLTEQIKNLTDHLKQHTHDFIPDEDYFQWLTNDEDCFSTCLKKIRKDISQLFLNLASPNNVLYGV
jgi:hypothetical protein